MNEEEIVRRAQTAIKRFDSLRIVGVGWSGNSRQGFQFNPESGLAGAAPNGGGTTPTTSGACCPVEGDCFIATQSICEAGGGTYQGDDTTCDPDPCACNICPSDSDTITVEISGLSSCGCEGVGLGAGAIDTPGAGGTFILSNTASGVWSYSDSSAWSHIAWYIDNTCSGVPFHEEDSSGLSITLQCIFDGVTASFSLGVHYTNFGANFIAFVGGGDNLCNGATVSNEAVCGSAPGIFYEIEDGGIATISW